MNRCVKLIFVLIFLFALISCNRKSGSGRSSGKSVYGKETGSVKPAGETHHATVVKTAVPKVITVNDAAASKTFDGRLYYDLEGHRYWKNYKDGKYYLFNKSMVTDPAFQKPKPVQ